MYRRFYHSKRRYILWAIVVVLAQALLFLISPDLVTSLERRIFQAAAPFPIFMPLYFAIGYGIMSRHTLLSLLVGAVSWWVAPLLLALQGQEPALSPLALAADGMVYAAIGFLAALITNFLAGKKVAPPS